MEFVLHTQEGVDLSLYDIEQLIKSIDQRVTVRSFFVSSSTGTLQSIEKTASSQDISNQLIKRSEELEIQATEVINGETVNVEGKTISVQKIYNEHTPEGEETAVHLNNIFFNFTTAKPVIFYEDQQNYWHKISFVNSTETVSDGSFKLVTNSRLLLNFVYAKQQDTAKKKFEGTASIVSGGQLPAEFFLERTQTLKYDRKFEIRALKNATPVYKTIEFYFTQTDPSGKVLDDTTELTAEQVYTYTIDDFQKIWVTPNIQFFVKSKLPYEPNYRILTTEEVVHSTAPTIEINPALFTTIFTASEDIDLKNYVIATDDRYVVRFAMTITGVGDLSTFSYTNGDGDEQSGASITVRYNELSKVNINKNASDALNGTVNITAYDDYGLASSVSSIDLTSVTLNLAALSNGFPPGLAVR